MYSHEIKVKFKIGQIVYLKTDAEKNAYVVIGYTIRELQVRYLLKCNEYEGEFLNMEIDPNNLGISAN
jgi:hypothetical protein